MLTVLLAEKQGETYVTSGANNHNLAVEIFIYVRKHFGNMLSDMLLGL